MHSNKKNKDKHNKQMIFTCEGKTGGQVETQEDR